jgi:Fic family protein
VQHFEGEVGSFRDCGICKERMDELLAAIAAKKQQLDALRPVSRAALHALQKSYDVDLTYTSNAIEGNTLTLRETAELIENLEDLSVEEVMEQFDVTREQIAAVLDHVVHSLKQSAPQQATVAVDAHPL